MSIYPHRLQFRCNANNIRPRKRPVCTHLLCQRWIDEPAFEKPSVPTFCCNCYCAFCELLRKLSPGLLHSEAGRLPYPLICKFHSIFLESWRRASCWLIIYAFLTSQSCIALLLQIEAGPLGANTPDPAVLWPFSLFLHLGSIFIAACEELTVAHPSRLQRWISGSAKSQPALFHGRNHPHQSASFTSVKDSQPSTTWRTQHQENRGKSHPQAKVPLLPRLCIALLQTTNDPEESTRKITSRVES